MTDPHLPPAVAMLAGAGKARIVQAYEERRVAGEAEERIVTELSMRFGFAPSYIRMLIASSR